MTRGSERASWWYGSGVWHRLGCADDALGQAKAAGRFYSIPAAASQVSDTADAQAKPAAVQRSQQG